MTDASPVNRYLLFDRSDEFRTNDKVLYALHNNRLFLPGDRVRNASSGTFGHDLERRMLLRTLDELKRGLAFGGERSFSVTPNAGTTLDSSTTHLFSPSYLPTSPTFNESADFEVSPVLLEDTDDLDGMAWDNLGNEGSYWSWPMEILYQSYHLTIALDFSRATFEVSRNGVVLADRIPVIVDALLDVIKTTIQTRAQSVRQIRRWLDSNVLDETARAKILRQVWDPRVYVSVILLNAPKPLEKAVPFSIVKHEASPSPAGAAPQRSGTGGADARERACGTGDFASPEATRFTSFDAYGGDDVLLCSRTPILTRCDAQVLLEDPAVVERLRRTLMQYESACREQAAGDWLDPSFNASLEFLVRTVPESAPDCQSIVLVSNMNAVTSSNTIAFLESAVRRKNIILSVVALNRLLTFDSPQLSPLAQFLSSTGGFAVHIDYWLALAHRRLNSDWCHRFEGARCLAQQLFVHLVNGFPVSSTGVTQRHAFMDLQDPVLLYGAYSGMDDFILNGSTFATLQAIAGLRFNEGWSVLVDYRDESSAAHLIARYHHLFHRGALTLHYEMDINRPAVYRRLLVSGTKTLVDHFARLRLEEKAGAVFLEPNASWLAYVTLLRIKLHSWVQAEEVMLKLLSVTPQTRCMPSIPAVGLMSTASGASSAWLDMFAISSVGVFFRYDDLRQQALLTSMSAGSSNSSTSSAAVPPPVSAVADGRALVRTVMLKTHRALGREDELFFFGGGCADCPAYVVQFFLLQDSVRSAESCLACGFECRVSILMCEAGTQRRIVSDILYRISQAVAGWRCGLGGDVDPASALKCDIGGTATGAAAGERQLSVCTSFAQENYQALLMAISAIAPRRMELLSFFTESAGSSSTVALRAHLRGVPQSAVHGAGRPVAMNPKSAWGILHRALREPYVTSAWSTASSLSFRWTLGCAEAFPHFAEECFNFAVLRRLREGFRLLLHYGGTLKAVLHKEWRTRSSEEDLTHVFDVLEAQESANATNQVMHIFRVITPFRKCPGFMLECKRDVQEDLHILTALHTYRSYSTLRGDHGERYPAVVRDFSRRGVTLINARVESLLQYLREERVQVVELQSPSYLGPAGTQALRDRLAKLLSSMGDRCATVAVDSFREPLMQLLSSSKEPLAKSTKALVATMFPIRYQTVLFVLILHQDSSAGRETGSVRIAIASLDAALLHHGLEEQYRLPCAARESAAEGSPARHRGLPECAADRAVVASISQIARSFAAVYSAEQLINAFARETRCAAGEPLSDEAMMLLEGRVLPDLTETSAHLGTFAAEIDASYLLSVVRSRYGRVAGEDSAAHLQRTLQSVLSDILYKSNVRPFVTHPSLFLPTDTPHNSTRFSSPERDHDRGRQRDANNDSASSSSSSSSRHAEADPKYGVNRSPLSYLPVLMKIGASILFPTDASATSETPEDASFWVTAKVSPPVHTSDEAEWTPLECPTSGGAAASPRLKLRFFVKTVPTDIFELCKDGSFQPSPSAVRFVLRNFIYHYTSHEAPSAAMATPTGALTPPRQAAQAEVHQHFTSPAPLTTAGSDSFFEASSDFSVFSEEVERAFRRIGEVIAIRIADYCLKSSFRTSTFRELREVIMNPSDRSHVTQASGIATPAEPHGSGGDLAHLAQPDASVPRRASAIAGIHDLLRQVVTPALLGSPVYEVAMFPVEFTQQTMNYRSVNPIEAALDVFRRCIDEDHMCVIPTTDFSYTFIPNAAHFGERWVVVHVEVQASNAINKASILCFDQQHRRSGAVATLSRHLRSHIYAKITQISQLHLLKQLRDTQYASSELIPPYWGDQFRTSPGDVRRPPLTSGGGDNSTDKSTSSSFYLRGRNVLEIPIYYKLQHQCKKVLSRIASNSSRLELITIFNREQCFVVADDVEGDAFHYIRLVFVKDMSHAVSLTTAPPQVSASDRCPQVVVQLFSATTTASVARPLQKLQDFCYFLAAQELQGQLNYVQHTMISFNDLVFLQNQRLDSITINLEDIFARVADIHPSDLHLAMSILFLNLRGNKFKLFEVQNEPTHAKSNFVEHYNLEEGIKQETENPVLQSRGGGRIHRFVKIVDGLTDVLVSCALRADDSDCHVMVLERYLTKVPAERYINGESESIILKQLSEHVGDTIAELRFLELCRRRSRLPVAEVGPTVEQLLQISQQVCSRESPLMRHHAFSLDLASPAIFPFLVERLCGALHPFTPRCFMQRAPGEALEPVQGFPWGWIEETQNNPATDEVVIYITCGFDVVLPPACESGGPDGGVMRPTRALPFTLPDLPITMITTEEATNGILRAQGFELTSAVGARVVLRMSLLDGVSVTVFNLRDADFLLRLLDQVIQGNIERSTLLDDILLQRLGYSIPSQFNEEDLALFCCGDTSNVLKAKRLSINADVYRRRVNHVRFRPHCDEGDDALAIIIEGVYNRGLIVNYVFPLQDAIKVLYDETSRSLDECEAALEELFASGVIKEEPNSALKPQLSFLDAMLGERHPPRSAPRRAVNCRLVDTDGVPADALIACDYHRHVLAAHIIVEAQNARSGVAEVLARCDALWRAGPQNNVLELAKSIVTLQQKSKEVFGSRVPDFSLRQERWNPEDDVLEPTLPSRTQQNSTYCQAVDVTLRTYMQYLQRLYPAMCVIDLDPNDPLTTSDDVLLNRLRCRYGKVVDGSGEVVQFSPHLYYAVIPMVDLIHCKGMYERYGDVLPMFDEEALASPITTSGLFIVEVGLQVVHYALDFFVINGDGFPLGVTATVAADFRQSLVFSSILYDMSVQHLLQCVQLNASALTGRHETSTAVANLVKYYPSPPWCSTNIAAVYHITDPRVMRLRDLPSASRATAAQVRLGEAGVMYLLPQKEDCVVRARTKEAYHYCGVIRWETEQLFVLLATAKDVNSCARFPSEDMSHLALQVRNVLVTQLLDSTQRERLDAAWVHFVSARTDVLATHELPSYDEFELLRNHSHKIVLQSYRATLQMFLEPIEWNGEASDICRACEQLFPDRVARVISREPADVEQHRRKIVPAGSIPVTTVGGWDPQQLFESGAPAMSVVITFAPRNPNGRLFLAMELVWSPEADVPLSVEDVSLYRRMTELPSAPLPAVAVLTEEERDLTEQFMRLVANTMWNSIVPCPSQLTDS